MRRRAGTGWAAEVREYILVLLVAMVITFMLAPVCRSMALRSGAVAIVRDRDVHARPIPYFGGLAMLGGVAVAFVLASSLPFLGKHRVVTNDSYTILLAAAIICGVGVLDDIFDLPALTKAAGQVLAAGVAVMGGVQILWIPLPGQIYSLDSASSIAITVFLIFLCVNAINFVDGLDGLAAGVVAIGALAFFGYTYFLTVEQDLVRATTSSLVTVALCGACLGYLPHNFYPARMFMGDSGSMLLGLLLATSAISLTGQIDPASIADTGGLLATLLPLILPVAVIALPLLDLVLAYVRRTWKGRWWFLPDKGHLHHRLLQRGHSQTRAVLLMYGWTAVVAFGIILIASIPSWWTALLVVVILVTLSVVTLQRRPLPPTQVSAPAAEAAAAGEATAAAAPVLPVATLPAPVPPVPAPPVGVPSAPGPGTIPPAAGSGRKATP